MGTRNLICVFLNGEYRVAQYGQFDGYPKGQGKTVLNFLQSMDEELFKHKLLCSQFASEKILSELDYDNLPPQFDIDKSAKILSYICKQPDGMLLKNSIDFAGDSLFCEWAYVIDLDQQTLEVYRGFNKHKLQKTDRFYHYKIEEYNGKKFEYEPIKLICSYNLSKLPTLNQLEIDAYPERIMESVLNSD